MPEFVPYDPDAMVENYVTMPVIRIKLPERIKKRFKWCRECERVYETPEIINVSWCDEYSTVWTRDAEDNVCWKCEESHA